MLGRGFKLCKLKCCKELSIRHSPGRVGGRKTDIKFTMSFFRKFDILKAHEVRRNLLQGSRSPDINDFKVTLGAFASVASANSSKKIRDKFDSTTATFDEIFSDLQNNELVVQKIDIDTLNIVMKVRSFVSFEKALSVLNLFSHYNINADSVTIQELLVTHE